MKLPSLDVNVPCRESVQCTWAPTSGVNPFALFSVTLPVTTLLFCASPMSGTKNAMIKKDDFEMNGMSVIV
jgi:hypothetical protein